MAPLTGLKVIEAASFLSGPMAGMMLADLGATVVKVEPPRGDPYRRFGKPYGDSSLLFKAANGNKTSIALDLRAMTASLRCSNCLPKLMYSLQIGAHRLPPKWG